MVAFVCRSGVAGRAMVKALIEGQSPAEVLMLAGNRLKADRGELLDALNGDLTAEHRFVLRELMAHVQELEQRIDRFDRHLLHELEPYRTTLALMQNIPGIDAIGAALLLVEIGNDMEAFGSVDRLASWVGICPGNNESAGKRKSGRIRKGNPWVRRLLCQFAHAASRKPNILVIWGDDIGTWNISHNNRGMMGYQTPNIDRIAKEGVGLHRLLRAAELHGGPRGLHQRLVPVRTGMTKVGHARRQGRLAEDRRDHGHGAQEPGLRHRPVRQEPPGRPRRAPAHHARLRRVPRQPLSPQRRGRAGEPDYPKNCPTARPSARSSARAACCKCKADGKGGQTIENTGPLTKKRMETIDEETVAAAKDFITRQAKAGKPFFCWWNGTRMHFRTHVKAEHKRHLRADEYSDGMVEHDGTSANCSS
jgi:hypothetical protein